MDRLSAMTALVAAVDNGSLSAAARKLNMPLATLSRKVADLEAHLKTSLLVRANRHLSLTEAGRAYVASARRVLEQVDEAERLAAGEYTAPRGDLVISAPIVFGRLYVLPVILEFLRAYPEVNVRTVFTDRIVHLVEERIDAALRIGELADSSIVATRIGVIRRVVCASPAYLAAHGEPRTPEELKTHECISFDGLTGASMWRFGGGDAVIPIQVRSRLVVNTAEASIDAAVAGAGITRVLSYQAAGAVDAGRLRVIMPAFEGNPMPVSLVHATQPPLPLKLRAFLDFATPRLRAALASGKPAG